jgi:uncharacterized protein involved in response to NO
VGTHSFKERDQVKRIDRDEKDTIFDPGMRTFFILAVIAAIYYLALWTAYYTFKIRLNFVSMSPLMWHAHEMIFGYSVAIIAGFLLTIERYWSGLVINKKSVLILLLSLWILARVFLSLTLVTDIPYIYGAVFDCLFVILLTFRVLYPVIKSRSREKIALVAHLSIIAASNVLFYLGVAGVLANGQRWGIYSALYIVISIIVLMGRRMIPIFIRNGLNFTFEPKNRRVIDILSVVFFLLFYFLEVFFEGGRFVLYVAGVLALIYAARLYGWYSNRIWGKPMLWVLFVAYSWIALGFGLKFLSLYFTIPQMPALHSFVYGGIGMMTIGFMARATLGHTGRNVFEPPKIVFWIFSIMLAGAIVRVLFPMADMSHYLLWIAVSQVLWILAFSIFAVVFIPMLWNPPLKDGTGVSHAHSRMRQEAART